MTSSRVVLLLLLIGASCREGDAVARTEVARRAYEDLVEFLQQKLAEQKRDEGEVEEDNQEAEEQRGVGLEQKREILNPLKRGADFTRPVLHRSKVTQSEIKEILDLHRKERTSAGASNEMDVSWDPELARLAQGLSDSCVFSHLNLKLPNGKGVGQNIVYWSNMDASMKSLVDLWINEKKDYHAGPNTCNGGKVCGHYTQMVWSESVKVGCGVSECPGMGRYLVCDYSPPGNWQGKRPFDIGQSCSKCNLYPGTACNNGLCSVCTPGKDANCRKYDASSCKDAMLELDSCDWVKPMCSQDIYRQWLEKNCAKTCKFCHS